MLSRLVNDLQWRYTVDEVKRGYTKEITRQAGSFCRWSFGLGALTLAFPELKQFDLRLLVPAVLAGCWGAAFSMLSSLRDRLEASDLDALKVLRARWVLGSRVLIGAGAASVLYFFFVSGLVTGAAFPNLHAGPTVQAASDLKAAPNLQAALNPQAASNPEAATDTNNWRLDTFALLVVWCFLAGFSERLIPGLLARTGETRHALHSGSVSTSRLDSDIENAGILFTKTLTGKFSDCVQQRAMPPKRRRFA